MTNDVRFLDTHAIQQRLCVPRKTPNRQLRRAERTPPVALQVEENEPMGLFHSRRSDRGTVEVERAAEAVDKKNDWA